MIFRKILIAKIDIRQSITKKEKVAVEETEKIFEDPNSFATLTRIRWVGM